MHSTHKVFGILCAVLSVCIFLCASGVVGMAKASKREQEDFIKWVDFNLPESAMEQALWLDIKTEESAIHLDWITLLSVLGTLYWGEWDHYQSSDMQEIANRLLAGEDVSSIVSGYEKYDYFHAAYSAVLGGMVGSYQIGQKTDVYGHPVMETRYGLRAYSPIAYGFSFSHYPDFGSSRSYGYHRRYLGNDLLASVGTPIVAVESGIVTHCGWNEYGGWRVGIRSFDGLRYYYYAHCRKDHPYAEGIEEGALVIAGQPIGYVGMTGYSDQENVNGMTVPHLHFGLQLIFDPSQEEGESEIWVDVYEIVNFLEHHKSALSRGENDVDYTRKYPFVDPTVEAFEAEQEGEKTVHYEQSVATTCYPSRQKRYPS